ncbi:MAG TPA: hypothetical protein VII23_17760 [Terriglobales bacterium]|jgi:hypothetical protein
MKYLKRVLAGIAALILVLVLIPITALLVALVYSAIANPPQTGGAVGWDPLSLLHQIPIIGLLPGWTPLIVPVLLVFTAGFYWQFRRDARKLTLR